MKPPVNTALDKLRRLRRDRERLAIEALGRERAGLAAAEARERAAEAEHDAYERRRQVCETELYDAALAQPVRADALERLGDQVSALADGSRRHAATVQERRGETGQAEIETAAARAGWRDRRRDADRLDQLEERHATARRKANEISDDVAAEDDASLRPPDGRP
jgi:flagellar biosynthesis chaperone FliJ